MFATALTQISHSFYAIRSCLGIRNAKNILISQVILYISCLKNLTHETRIQFLFGFDLVLVLVWTLKNRTLFRPIQTIFRRSNQTARFVNYYSDGNHDGHCDSIEQLMTFETRGHDSRFETVKPSFVDL